MTTATLILSVSGSRTWPARPRSRSWPSYSSPGTRQAYATQLRLWFDWCEPTTSSRRSTAHPQRRQPSGSTRGRPDRAPSGETRRDRQADLAHSLRHAAITAALDAGCNLRDVQDFARHADPRQTRRYDRARGALDRNPTYIVRPTSPEQPTPGDALVDGHGCRVPTRQP